MKHDDAPHTPDRRLAKRYNIDMPHGVPTTSAKGSAQVRIVRATRALNMKPLGVVGDPLALLRDLRGADPSSPMDQTSSIGKTFDAIHDRSFSPAPVVDFEASTVTSTVTFFDNDDQAPTRPGPQSGSTYKANITGTSPPLPPITTPPPTRGSVVIFLLNKLFRWAVWLRLRSAVRERARQAAYSGHGTHGALNDLDAPLT